MGENVLVMKVPSESSSGAQVLCWESLLVGLKKLQQQHPSDLQPTTALTTLWNRLGNLLQSGVVLRERVSTKKKGLNPFLSAGVNDGESPPRVSEAVFSKALRTAILDFLEPENVCREWETIFRLYNNGHEATAMREAKQITGGYRLVANYYLGGALMTEPSSESLGENDCIEDEDEDEDEGTVLFNPRVWLRSVLSPLFFSITRDSFQSIEGVAFLEIFSFDILSKEVHETVLDHLLDLETGESDESVIEVGVGLDDEQKLRQGEEKNQEKVSTIEVTKNLSLLQALLNSLSPDWSCRAISLFLRRSPFTHSSRRLKTSVLLQSISSSILKRLLSRALTAIDPVVIIDLFLVRRAYSNMVSDIIVKGLPRDCLTVLIETVGCVWNDKFFIARGDEKRQEYLTNTLITSLERIDEETLSQRGPRGIPLAMVLSTGVSAYLDSSDKLSRVRGMRVAVAFSTLMKRPILFDELEEHYKEQKQREEANATTLMQEVKGNSDKHNGDNQEGDGDDDDAISSSSTESEIEAYDLGEDVESSDFIPRAKPTTFLRVCLELLQYPDSKEKAFEKHQSALTSIPKIVANYPADAGDVCGPLVRELLSFPNSFNMENFDELRSSALQSLLTCYPTISVKVITWSLESKSVGLGVKINAIAALARASYTLAGLAIPGEDEEKKGKVTVTSEKEEKVLVSPSKKESSLLTSHTPSSSVVHFSKTVVKRPAKLAQSQRKRIFFRNNFAPLAQIFYYPILKLIASLSTRMENYSVGDSSTSLDEIEYLLFAQALLALGAFTRCTVNSPVQRQLTLETLKVAAKFVQSASLSLRRAALVAFHAGIEARMQQRNTGSKIALHAAAGITNGGALGILTNITRLTESENSGNKTEEEDMMIAAFVEWAVSSLRNDSDPHSRAIKCDAVELAMKSLDL